MDEYKKILVEELASIDTARGKLYDQYGIN